MESESERENGPSLTYNQQCNKLCRFTVQLNRSKIVRLSPAAQSESIYICKAMKVIQIQRFINLPCVKCISRLRIQVNRCWSKSQSVNRGIHQCEKTLLISDSFLILEFFELPMSNAFVCPLFICSIQGGNFLYDLSQSTLLYLYFYNPSFKFNPFSLTLTFYKTKSDYENLT